MKRIQKMLAERGRKLAGWDEVSHGGGVDPDGTLLMAWQKPEVGLELARQGYDVVMTRDRPIISTWCRTSPSRSRVAAGPGPCHPSIPIPMRRSPSSRRSLRRACGVSRPASGLSIS